MRNYQEIKNFKQDLCSFTKPEIDKRYPQEFVLRFFAFLNNYQNYSGRKVHEFLDDYLEQENKSSSLSIDTMKNEFYLMLKFVEKHFPNALHIYRKIKNRYEPTTRIKFESISVGIALALRENPNLVPKSTGFLDSQAFKDCTQSDASSSQNKVNKRIHYVRDRFDKEKLFSGNIDARKIRKTSEMYGFSCKTNSQKTKDGSDLLTVKTNRNDLAHGFKSFEEVGRDATADELLEIKKRVISYLKGILENIESYLSNKEYLK